MGTEQLLGGLTLIVLGVAVAVVGWLGRVGRLDFALGGWTRASATPELWVDAHRTIGAWFVGGGALAIGAGPLAFAVSHDSVGAVVVGGPVAMLVPVVVGVAIGSGRLRRRWVAVRSTMREDRTCVLSRLAVRDVGPRVRRIVS